jgi:Ni/Co efflux regulator RcnB
MKLRWWMAACATLLFAGLGGTSARAQDHPQDHHEHHWDEHNPRFDEHEHQVVNDWWAHHHDHPVIGFRAEDRLPRDWDGRLVPGFVLDVDWRHRLHPVPADLMAELPPPPYGYRYYVIGGHIVLVDRDWRVEDVININGY